MSLSATTRSHPPLERIGALAVGDFLPLKERKSLAAARSALLASATFATWRQGPGAPLDIREWRTPKARAPPPSSSAWPTSTTTNAPSSSAS
jgi:hypothetical protein